MKLRILIVDDEPNIRQSLTRLLEDEGHQVHSAPCGESALERIRTVMVDLTFLDLKLPGMDGLQVLKSLRDLSPETAVIMMSGQSDLDTAVQATKLGAHTFLEKPLNPERVLIETAHIERQLSLEARVDALESIVDDRSEIIGESFVMRRLKETIIRAAPTDGRILILGENGTGKELVARAVHRQSKRKDAPFISLNCAAIPGNLVESELFGHEKGAFTGADRQKPGRFEIADRGTLFLDEIGDMNLETQAKLLRVLQENEAVRLGGNTPYAFDVRVISATNKDLSGAIEKGAFREDLFYRLNVIPIHVPSLRDRRDDIPLLVHHFLKLTSQRTGLGQKQWGEGCMTHLQLYDWPGNVRELMNFTERMAILSRDQIIGADEVRDTLPARTPALLRAVPDPQDGVSFREQVENFEKQLLLMAHEQADGNVSRMARLLQIDRANLHRKLKSYGIK
ncbi:sigma-54-dependent Fis family transcriptional regulator [bacterium]|nr:sigma-54-dependent Fis family transcriptional regulator [bacterium]